MSERTSALPAYMRFLIPACAAPLLGVSSCHRFVERSFVSSLERPRNEAGQAAFTLTSRASITNQIASCDLFGNALAQHHVAMCRLDTSEAQRPFMPDQPGAGKANSRAYQSVGRGFNGSCTVDFDRPALCQDHLSSFAVLSPVWLHIVNLGLQGSARTLRCLARQGDNVDPNRAENSKAAEVPAQLAVPDRTA